MEATKGIKPATPLPWEIHAFHQWRYEDAAYIVHAANNYGRLVEALREVTLTHETAAFHIAIQLEGLRLRAAALLRELGEE